jgi:low affinity Fe/Cu permease
MENSKTERRISRVLHWIDDLTARAGVTVLVTIVVVVFAIALAIKGFPGRWEEGFSTAATSVTLIMLFIIQHTQNRQQVAVQLKLDELIRASPEADDLLVQIESAKDEELIEREQEHLAQHDSLRDPESKGNETK